MAEFNADIKLSVLVDKALNGVKKVEQAINKIKDVELNIRAKGLEDIAQAKRSVKVFQSLAKATRVAAKGFFELGKLAALATAAIGSVSGGAIGLTAAFAGFKAISYANNFKAIQTPVSQLAALLDSAGSAAVGLTAKFAELVATAPGLTGAIALTTVGLAAFGPQIATASKRLLDYAKAAGGARLSLNELLNTYSKLTGAFDGSFFEGPLPSAEEAVKAYRKALFEVSETISELQRRQSSLQTTLNRFNSSSETAVKVAKKLVDVNSRLNDELREQKDLLRSAAGVNVTELEAAKGKKSIQTREKQKNLATQQAKEFAEVNASIEKLIKSQAELDNARLNARAEQEQIRQEKAIRAANDETIRSLERRAQLEERIQNVRSARVARQQQERRKFLEGNPNQFPEGAVGPTSGRADSIKAATKAAQQRFAITSSITKALAGQTLQYRLQLGLLAQAAKIGKQIEDSIEEQRKKQRRLNRELKVRKGREKQKRAGQLNESLALGAGFPLLFGAGPGSVLGSIAGSFVGTGFGGQILGGALGQVFDEFGQRAVDLSVSLDTASDSTAALEALVGRLTRQEKKRLENLAASGQAAKAATAAFEILSQKIGRDNAAALIKAGRDFDLLGRTVQSVFTAIGASIVGFIQEILFLNTDVDPRTGQPKQIGPDKTETLQRNEQRERAELSLQRIDTEISEALLNKDLDRVDAAKRRRAEEEADLATRQVQLDLADELISREQGFIRVQKIQEGLANKLLNLDRERLQLIAQRGDAARRAGEIFARDFIRRQRDADRAAKRAAREREAAAQKELAVQRTLKSLEIRETQFITQGLDTSRTRGEQVAAQLQNLNILKEYRRELILLSGEDARIQSARLVNLERETEARRRQLQLQQKELEVQKQLAALESKQQVAGLSQQLNQELAQANFRPTGIGDEAAQLQLQQAQRYESTLADINNQLAIQNKLAASGVPELVAQANATIPFLEQQRDLYKQLLPQIFAAEQAQLKFNQTLALVGGPVNAGVQALVGGLRDVVAGTKSAEEAFADFLNAIANALIQTATTMIAQYIAIGIARAFAGVPTPGEAAQSGFNMGSGLAELLPGRAEGGPVVSGEPYVVGERGPELFVPGASGQVINNEDTQAFADAARALRNFDSSSAETVDAEAFNVAGEALARNTQVINNRQSTTQQETSFNNFTEAMMRPGQSTVRFETVNVGDMPMVTRDEALKIGANSAKAAEANVFKALRNKPTVRRSIGMG